jgi:hypothetical protein
MNFLWLSENKIARKPSNINRQKAGDTILVIDGSAITMGWFTKIKIENPLRFLTLK